MKKMLSVSCVLVLTGVGLLDAQAPIPHPFYPLNIGDRWTYRMLDLKAPPGKVDVKKKVVVEIDRQEIYQQKDANGKAEQRIGFMQKTTSGGKTTYEHVVVLPDGIVRVRAAGTHQAPGALITPPLMFLKFGTNLGETWECDSTSGNTTIKGTFSIKSDAVTVPFGKVDAVRVSFTNHKSGAELVEVDYWFAQKVGMVKQRVREKDRVTALELEKYEPK